MSPHPRAVLRPLTFALWAALGLVFMPAPLPAQVVAWKGVPAGQQPQVGAAGIDGPLATAITAAASTAAGAALGGTAGGSAALNEVANNHLTHSENEVRLKAARACVQGDAKACDTRDKWDALDRERDARLRAACFGDGASAECSARYADLQVAQESYIGKTQDGAQFARDVAAGLYRYTALAERDEFGSLINVPHYDAQAIARAAGAIRFVSNLAIDMTPGVGDVKAFAEANTKFEYALAVIGALGPAGDVAKALIKEAKVLYDAGNTAKAAEKLAEASRGLGGVKGGVGFATESNQAFFWSGLGRGGDKAAAEIAANRGGTTLEQTISARGIDMPTWDAANPASVQAWQNASRAYAEGASGTVRAVIGESLRPGSIWETIELPALKANPNVTQIIRVNPSTGAETVIFSKGGL